jgi:L-lactate utilization protein LutB
MHLQALLNGVFDWIGGEDMVSPVDLHYERRLRKVKAVLESNAFEVFLAENASRAKEIILNEILPGIEAKSISFGGSKTFNDLGLLRSLMENKDLEIINPFSPDLPPAASMEMRRKSLWADVFFTGTNAFTEAGQLVNLDRTGNRIAALSFGPKFVIVLAGRNKMVSDLKEAFARIKNYTAPLVAVRVGAKTPCSRTSVCEDCRSPERVCNAWSIVEKSFPEKRVKIVLINEDVGF